MKVPGSAADLPKKQESNADDVMIIVQDQRFMLSVVDAISLAGTINAIVAGKMRSESKE